MKSVKLFSIESNLKVNNKNTFQRTFGSINYVQNDKFNPSAKFVAAKKAEILKQKGNQLVSQKKYQEAIRLYERGIVLKPDYDDLYLNLGKVYKKLGDDSREFQSYQRLLRVKPNHIEGLTLIGEVCKSRGDLGLAQGFFEKAVSIDKGYDYALRNIKEIEYLKLANENPQKAEEMLQVQSQKNIIDSISYLEKYFSKDFIKEIENVQFSFGKTSSVEGVENIAQYENGKKRIVVTDKYIWASPQVVAAYLVHEAIHAKDKDAFTSIREEQDAYRESVRFWAMFNEGIKDPELDYALSLYKDSPQALDSKVKEVYSVKGDIPMTSPYHGISMKGLKKFFFNIKAKFLSGDNSLKNQQIIS